MEIAKVNKSELPIVPPIEKGYQRQWCRCNECGMLQYYDYVPYSLSNPITVSACGHDFATYVKPISIIERSEKEQRLYDSIKKFRDSIMGTEDFMQLFVEFYRCIRPDSDLVWSQVQEVLDDVLKENPK